MFFLYCIANSLKTKNLGFILFILYFSSNRFTLFILFNCKIQCWRVLPMQCYFTLETQQWLPLFNLNYFLHTTSILLSTYMLYIQTISHILDLVHIQSNYWPKKKNDLDLLFISASSLECKLWKYLRSTFGRKLCTYKVLLLFDKGTTVILYFKAVYT